MSNITKLGKYQINSSDYINDTRFVILTNEKFTNMQKKLIINAIHNYAMLFNKNNGGDWACYRNNRVRVVKETGHYLTIELHKYWGAGTPHYDDISNEYDVVFMFEYELASLANNTVTSLVA